jgi:hypothetical protein
MTVAMIHRHLKMAETIDGSQSLPEMVIEGPKDDV